MCTTLVHGSLVGLSLTHQGGIGVLDILSSVLEHVAPHLHMRHVALIAQTNKALRVFVNDVCLLRYILGFTPLLNSKETRTRFLIPRTVPLRLITKARYSQTHGLELAIQSHGSLNGFKTAWLERREKTRRRREKELRLLQEKYRKRLRRIALVQQGLTTVGLGHVVPNVQRHFPYAMFIHNVANVPIEREELHLSIVIENVCWDHYLLNHTNYTERIRERLEIMGHYPGLVNDIMSEFEHPEVWPWLE
jgi:hypothetical protein